MVELTMPNLGEFDVAPTVGDPAMEAELVGQNALKARRFQYCYWRKPDGYISIAPYFGDEMRTQYERGMEPLLRYGRFLIHTPEWDAFQDPYRLLFARGGAVEFSVEEIIEHGWHRPGKAPFGATFPQLAGVDLPEDCVCTICRKPFSSNVLLAQHQSVMHSDVSHEQSLGRNLANAITAAQASNNNQLADALMTLATQFAAQNEQMAEMMKLVLAASGATATTTEKSSKK